jgi:hypothetical protein
MRAIRHNFARERSFAKLLCGDLSQAALERLQSLVRQYGISLFQGDLKYLEGNWYVSHSGLLRLAKRRHCVAIHVRPILKLCNTDCSRWVFRAVVYKSGNCKGFVAYGDANPSNVSPLVHGSEMRVAETRAVNRALRKAYGIGICSIEEIGGSRKPPQSSEGPKGLTHEPAIVNYGGRKVRDRLCQIIRQHGLNPTLVKAYATDFCKTKALREATREQVENFVLHLANSAAQDRDALLCQLNSYLPAKGDAA